MKDYEEYIENFKETLKNKFAWMAIIGAVGFVIRIIIKIVEVLSE